MKKEPITHLLELIKSLNIIDYLDYQLDELERYYPIDEQKWNEKYKEYQRQKEIINRKSKILTKKYNIELEKYSIHVKGYC